MRKLTKEEAKELCFVRGEKYGLVDKSKNSIFLGSDTLEGCEDTLEVMTPAHPKYNDMEIVVVPDDYIPDH